MQFNGNDEVCPADSLTCYVRGKMRVKKDGKKERKRKKKRKRKE